MTDQEFSHNLHEAVSKGRLAEVREMLEAGDWDINSHHMMSRTALHVAATKGNVEAVQLLLEFHPDLKKVDLNENTPLHQAAMSNNQGSAGIAELLIGAGVELDRLNKFGRSALDESVLSDNMGAMEVLVTAGAKTENSLRLAKAKGKEKSVKYLEQKTTEAGIEGKGVEGNKAALMMKLKEIQLKEIEELEAKKKEKKKLLDEAKMNLRAHTMNLEEEIFELEQKFCQLKALLARYQTEEGKKIQAMTLELNELSQDLDWKLAGRVKAEDVAKCLECPVCLDLCKPPREIWQCSEGHIMCDSCADRPEMIHCSQCRTPLYALDGTMKLSRNRALEELASKTFPAVERERNFNGGRCRGVARRVGRGATRGRAAAARGEAQVLPRLVVSDTDEDEDEDQQFIVRLLRLVRHRVQDSSSSE